MCKMNGLVLFIFIDVTLQQNCNNILPKMKDLNYRNDP